ncbi:MAG: cobalamin biosynthesis protein [Alphaproteobacteria bacterium]|nr:cobalamin biosynthesis protein [Alphaproteobacteria bacterium]
MSLVLILIVALLIDAVIGDPDRLWRRAPHPAALMGAAISALEKRLNKGPYRRAKGVVALAVLIGIAALIGALVASVDGSKMLQLLLVAILLAQNSLAQHVMAVATGLRAGLPAGRLAVGMIVGRDADVLDKTGVARAAIESAAENFSDGVLAPAFWFLLLGLPGIMAYKIVNTADSMIGYRTERYEEFGWAAARLDDVMNWIPARLSGVLIAATYASTRAFLVMFNDAPKHRSPNAGWPEAAMAAVIGIAISGPRIYNGQPTEQPYVNASGRRDVTADDVTKSVQVIWRAWAGLVLILGLIWLAG